MRLDLLKLKSAAAPKHAPSPKKTKSSAVQPEASSRISEDQLVLSTPKPKAKVTSKPRFVDRLASKAKRLTLYGMIGVMGLNAIGPSITQAADAAWAHQNQTEILAEGQNLTSEQDRLTREEMSTLGDGAVAYLADHGVKLHIVDSDAKSAEVLTEHMNYPKVSTQQLGFVGKKAQQVGGWLDSNETVQSLENRIDSLQAKQQQEHLKWTKSLRKNVPEHLQGQPGMGAGMGGFGGMLMTPMGGGGVAPGSSDSSPNLGGLITNNLGQTPGMMGVMGQQMLPEGLLEVNAELSNARAQLHSTVAGELDKAALSEEVRPALTSGPSITVDGAVMMSGARTDQEKAEFRELIYEWNGERLKQAQSEGLQRMESNLAKVQNPEAQEFLSQQLELAKENPDLIPVNTNKGGLLLPNFSYHHFDGQKEDQSFRIPMGAGLELHNYVVNSNGLYNDFSRHSQVDANALKSEHGEKVVAHELAHALDGVMAKENPDFHKSWHQRVRAAYESAEHRHSHGHEVNSHYGMTNHKEYVAEGVEIFISDPDHLQETDPALFQLTQELLQEANRLGNAGATGKLRSAALRQLANLYTGPAESRKPYFDGIPSLKNSK